MSFERLFHPRGVAVIGASADLTRIGGHPLRALRKAGFTGGIYPVNPKYQDIGGLRCYPNARSIGHPCDLAVVAVPAGGVPAAIRDCGAANIAFAVVLTAGFREIGPKGTGLDAELKRAIEETGVRVVGPNCQGLLSVQDRIWAVFGSPSEETELRPGRVSCAFQSGGFGFAIVNLAEAQGVGFRYCVSTGNEIDLTTPELLAAFLDDPGTSLAFGYMEGAPDARGLLALGRKSLETGKPVLLWKGANTVVGARAAVSHTATMTGSYDLYRAVFRQSGLIEVDDVEPIVDFAKVFGHGRLPRGNNIGVLSISGGSGIVFADRAVRSGLTLPAFSQATLEALQAIVPAFGSSNNPVDVTAGIFNDMSLLTRTVDVVLRDADVDQLAILLASIPGEPARRAAEAITAAAAASDKPVLVAWSGRRNKSEAAYAILEAANVPVISTPVRLADAAARLARFAADRRRLLPRVPPEVRVPAGLTLPAGPVTLNEVESKVLLRAFGVPVTREVLVPEAGDPAALARELDAPFAVKVISRDVPHKTESGGVKLNVRREDLEQAARDVVASVRRNAPAARIDGVLVSEMAEGVEVLIGAVNDAAFGPTVALALGGVLAEALNDITFRVAPFDGATARDMIAELAGTKLLDGPRGTPAADREALADVLVRVSQMAAALGDRLKELDINPVFAGPRGRGVTAADALVVLA